MHNMTSWIGKVIDWLFLCVCVLGGGAAATDCQGYKVLQMVSSFFLTNTSGAAFRRHARWVVDQLVTFIIKCSGAFSTILLLLRTLNWNKWPPKVISYHQNAQEGSLFSDYWPPLQEQFNATSPNMDTSRLEAFKAEPPVRAAWLAALLPNTSAPGVKFKEKFCSHATSVLFWPSFTKKKKELQMLYKEE